MRHKPVHPGKFIVDLSRVGLPFGKKLKQHAPRRSCLRYSAPVRRMGRQVDAFEILEGCFERIATPL